jgi:hypothetical protein
VSPVIKIVLLCFSPSLAFALHVMPWQCLINLPPLLLFCKHERLQLTEGYEAAQKVLLRKTVTFRVLTVPEDLVSTLFNCHYNGFLVIQAFTVCAI